MLHERLHDCLALKTLSWFEKKMSDDQVIRKAHSVEKSSFTGALLSGVRIRMNEPSLDDSRSSECQVSKRHPGEVVRIRRVPRL